MKKGIKYLAVLYSAVFLLTILIPAQLFANSPRTPVCTIKLQKEGVKVVSDLVLHTQKWVSFDWVYQPDGTTNLSSGDLSRGSAILYSVVEGPEGPDGSSSCGFIFSTATVTEPRADVYFYSSKEYPYTFWANNGSGGIHDMGAVSLESIAQAPDASKGVGYFEFDFYDNQDTDVIIGHTYCIVTKDGAHYAKIYVTDMGTGQPPPENQPPTASFTVSDEWEKSVKVIPEGLLPGSEIGANVLYNWVKIDEQGRNVFQIYKIEGWSHYFVGAYRISIESKSGTLWSKLIPATPLEMAYYPEQLYIHADNWISVKTYGITEKEALGLWSIAAKMAGLPSLPPGDLPFFVGHNEDYLAPPNIDTSGFPSISEEGEVYPLILGCFCSPGELRIYDTKGRITGLVDGEVIEKIPNSAYFKGIFVILSPNDSYRYEVVGTEEKEYKIGVVSAEAEEANAFVATDVPTSTNTVHQYTIDWNALSKGEKAVTMKIDSDGDGTFEKTFTADSELTNDEFVSKMAGLSFWIWIAGGAGIILILVIACILIKRRLARK